MEFPDDVTGKLDSPSSISFSLGCWVCCCCFQTKGYEDSPVSKLLLKVLPLQAIETHIQAPPRTEIKSGCGWHILEIPVLWRSKQQDPQGSGANQGKAVRDTVSKTRWMVPEKEHPRLSSGHASPSLHTAFTHHMRARTHTLKCQ